MSPIPVGFTLSITDIADALSEIAPLYEEVGLSQQAEQAAKCIEGLNPTHRTFGPYFKQYDFMRIAADGIKKARRGKKNKLPLPYRSLREEYKVCDCRSPEIEGKIVDAILAGQSEEAIRIATKREWPDLLRFTHQQIVLNLVKHRRFEEAVNAALPLKKEERQNWYEKTLLEVIRQAVTGNDPQKYEAAERIIKVLEDLIPESLRNGRYFFERYASRYRNDAIWHLTRAMSEEQKTGEAKMWARKIAAVSHRAVTFAEISADELLQEKDYESTSGRGIARNGRFWTCKSGTAFVCLRKSGDCMLYDSSRKAMRRSFIKAGEETEELESN